MTHNEFKKELKKLLVKQVDFVINRFEAFEGSALSIEEVKNDIEVMRWQNLKGEIIIQILQITPSNDHAISADELWTILEYVEKHKRIAKKHMAKVDDFYSQLARWIENT